MTETPSPQVDSLAPAPAMPVKKPVPAGQPSADAVKRSKSLLMMLFGVPYLLFMLWAAALMAILPNPDGELKELVAIGSTSGLVAGAAFVVIGMVALQRISGSSLSVSQRQRSLIKVVAILIPGIVMAAALPIAINREPTLYIEIIKPTKSDEFVAPLAVTLSAERAQKTLQRLGKRTVKFIWDTNGDGKPDQESVEPIITTTYEQMGVYNVAMRIMLDGNDFRRLVRRVTIPRAVFSVMPMQPVIERPIRFSIDNLVPDKAQLKEVVWDFGDDTPQVVDTKTTISHTFYAPDDYTVTALVTLTTGAQLKLERTLNITNPPPLPFPVKVVTEPRLLIGPAPFGLVMSAITDTPVKEYQWDFGDNKMERGATLNRVSHTYAQQGVYPIVTRVRSQSGQLAELTSVVRVTPPLNLADLRFESPQPVIQDRVTGEIPLQVSIKPKTEVPLISFSWDIPEGSTLQAVGDTLQGTIREPRQERVHLIAQDSEDRVLRRLITITAKPPEAEAQVIARPDSGNAPLRVVFDASQSFIPPDDNVAGYRWTFGDEQQASEFVLGGARIEHVYTRPGEYDVRLAIVLDSGREYYATRKIIIRKPAIKACFIPSRINVTAGKGVDFDPSCSVGAIRSYQWDVRYDAQPDVPLAQSPQSRYLYVFEQPGTYTVRLTVRDDFMSEDTYPVTITVTDPSSEP